MELQKIVDFTHKNVLETLKDLSSVFERSQIPAHVCAQVFPCFVVHYTAQQCQAHMAGDIALLSEKQNKESKSSKAEKNNHANQVVVAEPFAMLEYVHEEVVSMSLVPGSNQPTLWAQKIRAAFEAYKTLDPNSRDYKKLDALSVGIIKEPSLHIQAVCFYDELLRVKRVYTRNNDYEPFHFESARHFLEKLHMKIEHQQTLRALHQKGNKIVSYSPTN